MVYCGPGFAPIVLDMLLSDMHPTPAANCKPGHAAFQRRIAIDVVERDSEFELLAEVPGVKKEAIQIDIDKDTLTISVPQPPGKEADRAHDTPADAPEAAPEGEKASASAESDKAPEAKVLLRERVQHFAKRSVKLPHTADMEQASAECTDGILKITMPKKALPTPKRIAIV